MNFIFYFAAFLIIFFIIKFKKYNSEYLLYLLLIFLYAPISYLLSNDFLIIQNNSGFKSMLFVSFIFYFIIIFIGNKHIFKQLYVINKEVFNNFEKHTTYLTICFTGLFCIICDIFIRYDYLISFIVTNFILILYVFFSWVSPIIFLKKAKIFFILHHLANPLTLVLLFSLTLFADIFYILNGTYIYGKVDPTINIDVIGQIIGIFIYGIIRIIYYFKNKYKK